MAKAEKIRISCLYYILIMLGYAAALITDKVRPGVLGVLLMVGIAGELVFDRKDMAYSYIDLPVFIYFIYRCLSIFMVWKSGFPTSLYIREFGVTVLPMIFYFVGKSIKISADRWYKTYLLAAVSVGLLGVILFIAAPTFYNNWLYQMMYISKADTQTMRVRMNSVIGSTCMSAVSVVGMAVGGFFLKNTNSRKEKNMAVIGIVICFICTVMANQRAGLVSAFFVFLYLQVILVFVNHVMGKKGLMREFLLLLGAFVIVAVFKWQWIYKSIPRLLSIPNAVAERSYQWKAAFHSMNSYLWGNGIGVNGHKAMELARETMVADGGLVKIFCEEGVLGSLLFLSILVIAFYKGSRHINKCYTELGIIAVLLFGSLGSNLLAFQLCTPVFWYAVGKIIAETEGK